MDILYIKTEKNATKRKIKILNKNKRLTIKSQSFRLFD